MRSTRETFRIGFITPPFRDNKIPVTDHLHAHGYVLPADLMSWWRAVGYSAMAWYDVDDLIAEIRWVPLLLFPVCASHSQRVLSVIALRARTALFLYCLVVKRPRTTACGPA